MPTETTTTAPIDSLFLTPLPLSQWNEFVGAVLWWKFPVDELLRLSRSR